jgi:hypothetical protein
MWLLTFVPDFIFHIIAIVGILLTVGAIAFGQIPFIGTYNIPINIIGVVLIIFGFYMEGGISNQEKWEAKVAEVKLEMAKKETASAEVTTKVITKYVTKIEVVKEKGNVIIKEIPKYISKDADAKCPVPNGFVVLHDSASRNEVPDSTRSIDAGTSEVKLSDVATTVTENYTTYHKVAEQLKSLQEWIKLQQSIYNK